MRKINLNPEIVQFQKITYNFNDKIITFLDFVSYYLKFFNLIKTSCLKTYKNLDLLLILYYFYNVLKY